MTVASRPRVLVIEDNPANRALMVYLLKAFGFEVAEAEDGEAGVAMARASQPKLVVCDVHLPKVDGYAVVRALKSDKQLKRIPVIAVTALAMVGDRDRILSAGFDGYISKPIEAELFVQRVTEFLPVGQRPAGRRAKSNAEPASATPKVVPQSSGTVLVIDDLSANVEFVRSTLASCGYTVRTAATVESALTDVEQQPPDLILCDWHMSPLGGRDLLDIAKGAPSFADIPIIVTSSTSQSSSGKHGSLEHGAADYIERPIEPEMLLEKVTTILRKRRKATE